MSPVWNFLQRKSSKVNYYLRFWKPFHFSFKLRLSSDNAIKSIFFAGFVIYKQVKKLESIKLYLQIELYICNFCILICRHKTLVFKMEAATKWQHDKMDKFFSTVANFQTWLGLNTIFLVIINLEELRNMRRYFNFELILWVDNIMLTDFKNHKFQ